MTSPFHPEATRLGEINNEQNILQDVDLETACMVPDETSGQGTVGPHETHVVSSPEKSSIFNLQYSIPQSDLALFSQLPDEVRTEIRQTLIALRAVASGEGRGASAAAELRRQALALNISFSRLRTKWFAYKQSGDWRVLVNRAKAGADWWQTKKPLGLPRPFIQFWKTLCEENQRVDAAAYQELKHIYKTGLTTAGKPRTIPGYEQVARGEGRGASSPFVSSVSFVVDSPSSPLHAPRSPLHAVNPFTGLPPGWSYENLTRYSPSTFEKAACRIGRTAAAQYRRKVFSTRVGLQVGQFILFDDQDYDLKINFLGDQKKAMRPLGLNALDLFSACSFAYGFKPTLLSDDGSKKKLREVDMMWFVVDILTRFGFNPDTGTHFVVEHGTAAIREDFEARIHAVTHGRVTVDRSGIGGAPSYDALFEGSAKGNPRFKAPLESFFNLVRGRFAALPGQVGKDRDHSPEELHGRDRYNDRLLRALDQLPPDRAALLMLPFMTWHQFVDVAIRLYHLINTRTEHDLEGWEKANLVAHEFRFSPTSQWEPITQFHALAPAMQMALAEQFRSPLGTTLSRTRKMSPQEVFNTGATRLQKVPAHCLPELLGLNFAHRNKQIRPDGYLIIEDQELSPEPLRYHISGEGRGARGEFSPSVPFVPSVVDSFSGRASAVNVYINPFDPSRTAVLTDDKNRYLGCLTPQTAPSRADLDGIHREMGAAKRAEAQLLAPIAARHAEAAREKTRMHQHNTAVLNGDPITPEEREMEDTFDRALAENIRSNPEPQTQEKEYL